MKISGWIVTFILLVLLCSCRAPDTPDMRLGSLPYPGLFTLFAEADPADLGTHHYAPLSEFLVDEQSRGILYTCRAGFLDLSHVRDTIDLSRYFYTNVSQVLLDGEREVVVFAFSPCRYRVTFHLPEQWKVPTNAQALPTELDHAVIELSVQLAWIATAWYEFLQFFGYKSAAIIPEERSAFTYDDMMAHVVGVIVAREALRTTDTEDAFNHTVTVELNRMLEQLQAVSPEKMMRAVELVEGKWWTSEGGVIRRHLDVGHEDGTLTPWLVRDLECCGEVTPEPFEVPPLIDSLRPDGAPLASIEIELRIFEAAAIRSAIPDEPQNVVPHRDFPHLIDHIWEELSERFGPDFDRPYPDNG